LTQALASSDKTNQIGEFPVGAGDGIYHAKRQRYGCDQVL
jgi:hypothetical protein